MAPKSRLDLINGLLCLALLGIAQWFFGNVYEAVVTAPNWRVGFEYEAITGRSQNADRPVRYYVPTTWLAVVVLWVATILGWSSVPTARRWLAAASGSTLAAVLLSVYIVTQLNLRLFFGGPGRSLDWVGPLMWQWQVLNGVRATTVGLALVATTGALRLTHRALILKSLESPPPH